MRACAVRQRVSDDGDVQNAPTVLYFDKSICIGCKACMAACPYDAIFINPGRSFGRKNVTSTRIASMWT